MTHPTKVALISGANKGLGFEIARQLGAQKMTVIVGARNEERGKAAQQKLIDEGIDAHYLHLDVTDNATILAAIKQIDDEFGRLDVLVNNAGIIDGWESSVLSLTREDLDRILTTNFYGVFHLTQAAVPLLKAAPAARVVNMSSSLGSLDEMANPDSPLDGLGVAAYRISKAALNALTTTFAKDLRKDGVKVNSACPGWVATDMGGPAAPRKVGKGAETPVWLATLPDDGPTGGFFADKKARTW